MNDHNLDDLIIDNIEPKQKQKAKGFLTILALAIVVLIVAIILTRILLKDPNEDKLLLETNETEMISPELTLQSAPEPTEKLEQLEQEIPEPTMVEEPVTPQEPEPALEPEPTPEPETMIEETPEEPTPTPVAEEPEPVILEPVEEPKEEEKQTEMPAPAKVPQHIIEEATQRPTSRPANVITRPGENVPASKTSVNGDFYIQVGAYKNPPSKSLLAKLKQNGFTYTVIRTSSGLNKVLVGPYPDRPSVDRALTEVKSRINRGAFVYKKN